MRTASLLCTLLFIAFTSIRGQNDVLFHSHDGEPFRIVLNNISPPTNYQANVHLKGIFDDTLFFKAEFENGKSFQSYAILLNKGDTARYKEFSYLIGTNGVKQNMVFLGMRDIGRTTEEIVPTAPVIDTSFKINNNLLGHYCELKEGKATYFNNIPSDKNCRGAMPDENIIFMNRLMRKAQTDDDRMSIAENTLLNNCVTTQQLEAVISHISYEIEKLKLIKLAYFNITDPTNCKNLKASFRLDASKRELDDFIAHSHQYKINRGGNCTVASSENMFNLLYQQLSVYSNDFERYHILKKQYTTLCYSLNQVKTILGLFLHDREKLDAAKLLYFYCTEQKEYLNVSVLFSYKISEQELKDFIEKQGN